MHKYPTISQLRLILKRANASRVFLLSDKLVEVVRLAYMGGAVHLTLGSDSRVDRHRRCSYR